MTDNLLHQFSLLPDLHQNPLYSQSMNEIGWKTLGDEGNYLYLKELKPFAVAKIQHFNSLDLDWLKKIRRHYHILMTYIEPGLLQSNIGKIGLKAEPFANSATSLVDLKLSPQDLLKTFKSKTRYNISYSQRKNNFQIITKEFSKLTISDLTTFKNLHESWSKRKKIICFEEKFFNAIIKNFANSGWIHFAYHQNKCIASLMILKNDQTAIYYIAFSDELGHDLFAPTLLTWTAMLTAKNAGCHIFDFGGIYDPRYHAYQKWQGFTKFKEGFSSTAVYYPPTQLLLGW